MAKYSGYIFVDDTLWWYVRDFKKTNPIPYKYHFDIDKFKKIISEAKQHLSAH